MNLTRLIRMVVLLAAVVVPCALCLGQKATVSRSSNLRKGPSTKTAVLESLKSGDTVTLTAKSTSGGYRQVTTGDGTLGWVLSRNLRIAASGGTGPTAPTTPTTPTTPTGGFTQTCSAPAFPSATAAPIDGTSCGVQGSGGAEAAQNTAKNNFCAASQPKAVTIADLVTLQQQVETDKTIPFGNPDSHPLSSAPGPATDRTALETLGEGTEVALTGFVKIARQEGSESVNCESAVPNQAAYHDIHISIVNAATDAECSGVVAEMIPHHRPTIWTPDLVNQVATSKLPVRLTGNLMFDSSHTPCINGTPIKNDPSRSALWEVHPIYKFEVCTTGDCSSGQGWVELEAWKPE